MGEYLSWSVWTSLRITQMALSSFQLFQKTCERENNLDYIHNLAGMYSIMDRFVNPLFSGTKLPLNTT